MDEQLANLKRKYEVLERDINDIAKLTPEQLRGFRYDIYWEAIEAREPLIKQDQETINENMNILQKQQEFIDKINKLYNEMKEQLNKKHKGTLQGKAGEITKKNNITPHEGDEIAKNVLEQHEHYDEAEHIERERNNNIGGKKRRIKNKITHKNKNKKSRRFIRNK